MASSPCEAQHSTSSCISRVIHLVLVRSLPTANACGSPFVVHSLTHSLSRSSCADYLFEQSFLLAFPSLMSCKEVLQQILNRVLQHRQQQDHQQADRYLLSTRRLARHSGEPLLLLSNATAIPTRQHKCRALSLLHKWMLLLPADFREPEMRQGVVDLLEELDASHALRDSLQQALDKSVRVCVRGCLDRVGLVSLTNELARSLTSTNR